MERFQATIQPILAILDEGLRLYRRGFLPFVLLTALWIVPLAIGLGLSVATNAVWWFLLALLLTLPLALYLVGGLSRLTLAVQQGHSTSLHAALAIPPQRLLGMGCYASVFYIAVNIFTSVIFSIFFCCGLAVLMALFGGAAAALDTTSPLGTAMSVVLGAILLILFALFYIVSLVISGATYSSLVYSLQPFVQHNMPFGDAMQRSIDLVFYRFGFNLAAFTLASIVFGATSLAVTTTIGALLPLPLIFLLGEESTLVQGISAFAWIIGLIVVLPPMPIWMALLYQRNQAAWAGTDLLARMSTILTRHETEHPHEP